MRSMLLTRGVAIALVVGALACARNKEETGTAVVEDTVRTGVNTGADTITGYGHTDSLRADSLRVPADTMRVPTDTMRMPYDSVQMPKPDSARN